MQKYQLLKTLTGLLEKIFENGLISSVRLKSRWKLISYYIFIPFEKMKNTPSGLVCGTTSRTANECKTYAKNMGASK